MKFSGSGIFKHTYENPERISQYEERTVLVEASSAETAKKIILEEFYRYAAEGIEFLQVFEIRELYEDSSVVLEVASSMKVFPGGAQEYVEKFWSDQRPESCIQMGWNHVWYNCGDGKSACYNCEEEVAGEFWIKS